MDYIKISELYSFLQMLDPDLILDFRFNKPHSYRGYYDCPCVSPTNDLVTVSDMLNDLNSLVTYNFEGYKGGEYTYDFDSFIYFAPYGNTEDEEENSLIRDYFYNLIHNS